MCLVDKRSFGLELQMVERYAKHIQTLCGSETQYKLTLHHTWNLVKNAARLFFTCRFTP